MRVGVISDIHSNIVAFRACTAYMEKRGCEEYIFLGDYVSDTPYTRETMDYLYEFKASHTCHFIRGNREDYILDQHRIRKEGIREKEWIYNSASGNLLFTYEQLTKEDIHFFSELPISFVYRKAGYPAIKCCHGSPDSSRELIQLGSDRAKFWLDQISEQYLMCAHTHFPGEYIYNDKHYINSGCVGIAINDAGFAQCLILESVINNDKTEWKPIFLKIPYDNHKVVRDIVATGLLDKAPWFMNSNILTLLTGDDKSASMVAEADRLSAEAGNGKSWPLIEEKYFATAAKKYQIPDYRKGLPDYMRNSK